SVVSMGVYIGQSTKIYNRMTGEVTYGRIPPGSVVVSGSLPAADGSHSLYCAVIVKRVTAATREKTSINELLRGDRAPRGPGRSSRPPSRSRRSDEHDGTAVAPDGGEAGLGPVPDPGQPGTDQGQRR